MEQSPSPRHPDDYPAPDATGEPVAPNPEETAPSEQVTEPTRPPEKTHGYEVAFTTIGKQPGIPLGVRTKLERRVAVNGGVASRHTRGGGFLRRPLSVTEGYMGKVAHDDAEAKAKLAAGDIAPGFDRILALRNGIEADLEAGELNPIRTKGGQAPIPDGFTIAGMRWTDPKTGVLKRVMYADGAPTKYDRESSDPDYAKDSAWNGKWIVETVDPKNPDPKKARKEDSVSDIAILKEIGGMLGRDVPEFEELANEQDSSFIARPGTREAEYEAQQTARNEAAKQQAQAQDKAQRVRDGMAAQQLEVSAELLETQREAAKLLAKLVGERSDAMPKPGPVSPKRANSGVDDDGHRVNTQQGPNPSASSATPPRQPRGSRRATREAGAPAPVIIDGTTVDPATTEQATAARVETHEPMNDAAYQRGFVKLLADMNGVLSDPESQGIDLPLMAEDISGYFPNDPKRVQEALDDLRDLGYLSSGGILTDKATPANIRSELAKEVEDALTHNAGGAPIELKKVITDETGKVSYEVEYAVEKTIRGETKTITSARIVSTDELNDFLSQN